MIRANSSDGARKFKVKTLSAVANRSRISIHARQVNVMKTKIQIETSGGSTAGEGGGGQSSPRLGPKEIIAIKISPKNTHICKPPFACQNVLKLTYSNLEFQNFPGEDPRTTLFKGTRGKGEGGEEWEVKANGRRERKDREGRGVRGRDKGGKEGGRGGMGWGWGGEGRGARHGLRPLETSSGSAPV